MENMVNNFDYLKNYKNKKVLITGNTGFKGSWLAKILLENGANVFGYSLKPQTSTNHFDLLKLDYLTYFANICDLGTLKKTLLEINPEIIFHLAAQPLVRFSYSNPVETYQTNVIGTLNVLEASKQLSNLKSIVVITTDKCYENINKIGGYVETDPMGGYDPYSSSKACAEILTSSYRNSFYNLRDFNFKHQTLIATARAGNVIGGGDWSGDRLIPDIVRNTSLHQKVIIRYPNAIRPWQHVLESVSGYLLLGSKLLNGEVRFGDSWNFGPNENETLSVINMVNIAKKYWKDIVFEIEDTNILHEANLLKLNINKANSQLGWHPKLNTEQAIEMTIEWYKCFYLNQKLKTDDNIKEYFNL
jgi:CDP-glucose 4,6-dehydratase